MLKRIAIPALLLFSAQAFGAEMIYAWGDGDSLSKTLTAVKFTFAHGDFEGLFKFVLLIAITMALISTARLGMKSDMLSLPKMFAMSMGISTLFIVWRIDTVVKDVNTNQNYVVDSVPWAVAKPLVWFTGAEKTLGEIMESTFAVPGDLTYSKSGFLSPFAIMDGAANAKIVDPYIFQSVDNFIIDCVAPDISSGYYDITALANSEDLWAEFADTNPARVVYYYDPATRQPQLETCQSAYNLINGNLNTYASGVGMTSLGSMLGGYTGAQISSLLGTSSNYFMGYSKSASSFLLQSIMVNQFSETYKNWATVNGMSNEAVAYGVGKGEQTAQANMVISGALGSKYLPVIKSILTIIIVALTPIVALLLLTPLFWKVLAGYLTTLIWLSLWHVGEVILNFYILNKAASYIQGVTDSNGVYNLVSKPVVDGKYIEYVNMAASMYWMIPTIAGVIVGGFGWMAFQGMTGGMTARVARGEGASMEVGSGEAKLGNITMNNARTNQQNWAANSSFGQGTNMNSSFGIDNGFKGSDMNSVQSNDGMTVAGQFLKGTPKYNLDSSGNKHLTDKFNYNYEDKDGVKHTGSINSGAIIGRDGNIIDGEVKDTGSDGTTTVKTYGGSGNGKYGYLMKELITTNGATTTKSYQGGVETSYTEGENNAGSVSTVGGRTTAIKGQINLRDTIGQELANQKTQGLENNLTTSLNHMLSGTQTRGSGITIAASEIAAASKTNARLRSQLTSASDTSVSTDAKSIGTLGTTEESSNWSNMDKTETSNALTNTLTKLAAPVLNKIGLTQDRLDKLGIKGVFQMSDGTIVAQTESGGKKFSLSNSAQKSFNHSIASAYVESVNNTETDQNSMTNSRGKTGTSSSSSSLESGVSASQIATAAKKLTETYVETLKKDNTIESGGAKLATLFDDFVKHGEANYKSQYGSGADGMRNAWAVQDHNLVNDFKQFAMNKLGLTSEPKAIFDDKEAAKIAAAGQGAQRTVEKLGVVEKADASFSAASSQPKTPSVKEAEAIIGGYPPITPYGGAYTNNFGSMLSTVPGVVNLEKNDIPSPDGNNDYTVLAQRAKGENGHPPSGQGIFDGNAGAAASAITTFAGAAYDYFKHFKDGNKQPPSAGSVGDGASPTGGTTARGRLEAMLEAAQEKHKAEMPDSFTDDKAKREYFKKGNEIKNLLAEIKNGHTDIDGSRLNRAGISTDALARQGFSFLTENTPYGTKTTLDLEQSQRLMDSKPSLVHTPQVLERKAIGAVSRGMEMSFAGAGEAAVHHNPPPTSSGFGNAARGIAGSFIEGTPFNATSIDKSSELDFENRRQINSLGSSIPSFDYNYGDIFKPVEQISRTLGTTNPLVQKTVGNVIPPRGAAKE